MDRRLASFQKDRKLTLNTSMQFFQVCLMGRNVCFDCQFGQSGVQEPLNKRGVSEKPDE